MHIGSGDRGEKFITIHYRRTAGFFLQIFCLFAADEIRPRNRVIFLLQSLTETRLRNNYGAVRGFRADPQLILYLHLFCR